MRSLALVLFALASLAGTVAPGAGAPVEGGLLLVVNKGDRTLGIIDPVAGKDIATVTLSGVTGHEVAASPDGRTAYVPIYGDSGVGRPGSDGRAIDVIDLASRRRTATIDLGRPQRPHEALFGPDGRLYVTTELTSSVTVIDPGANAVVATLPTDQKESHMLALSPDGRTAYTSNVGAGTVSVIDVAAGKVAAVVTVARRAQRISVSTDGGFVFTADQDAPRLAVIDTKTNKLVRGVALPAVAYGTAPTPDGSWLLVAMPGAGQVAEIDLVAWKVARLIPAGPMVDGLAWARQP